MGIAVEFCSHMVHAFQFSAAKGRVARAQDALIHTGSSVRKLKNLKLRESQELNFDTIYDSVISRTGGFRNHFHKSRGYRCPRLGKDTNFPDLLFPDVSFHSRGRSLARLSLFAGATSNRR